MRKKQAEKLFCDAMDALAKVGESPLNYCLSYARGFMAAENKKGVSARMGRRNNASES